MNSAGSLPQPNPNAISRRYHDEYVVVDPHENQAHALDGDVAIVWRCIEDRTWPPLPDERVDAIIAQLREKGLLESVSLDEPEVVGLSRRTLLKAGAGTFALVGLTTVMLPEAAAAQSDVVGPGQTVIPNGDTFSIAPGQTVYLTVIGGGGGGGANATGTGGAGGAGAAGAIWYGSIKNTGSSYVQLTVDVAAGGSAGNQGTGQSAGTGGAGGSGLASGGGGGTAGANKQGGGGGGGGSSAVLDGSTVLIVAGGGGGGGGGGITSNPGGSGQAWSASHLNSSTAGASQSTAGGISYGGGGGGGAGGGSIDGGAAGGTTGQGGYSATTTGSNGGIGALTVTPSTPPTGGAGLYPAGGGGPAGTTGTPGAVIVSTTPGG
jgi:hypothetical protein